MNMPIELQRQQLESLLSDFSVSFVEDRGELTLITTSSHYLAVCQKLSTNDLLSFETLIDLCAVDYLEFEPEQNKRFAVVLHLLSLSSNCRLRVRVFCEKDDAPLVASVASVWPCANWFEREAFDLFGVIFAGHPDLRRILTDYGFSGHPFRKDFPISGYVELKFDEKEQRVAYQPVSIEPRINVPRVIREDNYGDCS